MPLVASPILVDTHGLVYSPNLRLADSDVNQGSGHNLPAVLVREYLAGCVDSPDAGAAVRYPGQAPGEVEPLCGDGKLGTGA